MYCTFIKLSLSRLRNLFNILEDASPYPLSEADVILFNLTLSVLEETFFFHSLMAIDNLGTERLPCRISTSNCSQILENVEKTSQRDPECLEALVLVILLFGDGHKLGSTWVLAVFATLFKKNNQNNSAVKYSNICLTYVPINPPCQIQLSNTLF